MNEAETRAEHTDPALVAAGWGVVEAKAKALALAWGKLGARRKRLWQGSSGRNAEDHRRGEERPVRCAGPCGLCPSPAHPRRARGPGDGIHQYPLQQQTTGLSRFRALALCQRRRGGTRLGKAEAAAVPEVSRFNCGCRG